MSVAGWCTVLIIASDPLQSVAAEIGPQAEASVKPVPGFCSAHGKPVSVQSVFFIATNSAVPTEHLQGGFHIFYMNASLFDGQRQFGVV